MPDTTDPTREPMMHTLKTDPEPFCAVADGRKKLELRKADRDFRVGDRLNLLETVSTGAEMAAGAPLEYTGGQLIVQVTHVMHGPVYGLADGWCLMSIEDEPCSFDPDAALSAASPTDLHPKTADLVDRFAAALKEKLAAAEKKYGYSDGWADPGWMDECRAKLNEHTAKGDPRDVAAYCAFLWHHGERTAAPPTSDGEPSALERFNENAETVAEMANESPLERLRYFLSLALTGQDWLDAEPFLDALPCAQPSDEPRLSDEQIEEAAQDATTRRCYTVGLDYKKEPIPASISWRKEFALAIERVVLSRLPLHPLDALLPEICQLLDTAREDFMQRDLWTEWDQSVRDRITQYNLAKLTALRAAMEGQTK